MTRPLVQARGIYIASLDCDNDNNYGDDNNEGRRRGLGCKRPAFTSRRAMATTTSTTAMMTTNVHDEASGASTRHYYIASRNGNDDSNYGDEDNECRRQGLVRKRTAFSHLVAQRQRQQQQLATTNDKCQTTRPRAQAHNIFTSRGAMATATMATKTTNN